ncbi:NPCBM/NEW2 domain-containing protein [Caulobacter zeae]|uniref:NPCBM/NEW2 domain-containing protein n=1 Tax=Caulobacter zeae TaxID=2055137 RepID=UPI001F0B9AD0|nr:NPCBM/NEW2 domain-containing protein [Caulobacter zeae]
MANSRLEVRTEATFKRFSVSVGVDDASPATAGAVRFLIYGDGRLLARSKPRPRGQPPVALDAAIQGVQTLERRKTRPLG